VKELVAHTSIDMFHQATPGRHTAIDVFVVAFITFGLMSEQG
jgi:hypothetical protein